MGQGKIWATSTFIGCFGELLCEKIEVNLPSSINGMSDAAD